MRFVLITLAFVAFAQTAHAQQSPLSKEFCFSLWSRAQGDSFVAELYEEELITLMTTETMNDELRKEKMAPVWKLWRESISGMADIANVYNAFCK